MLLVETSEEIKRRKCDVEIELKNSQDRCEQLKSEYDDYKNNVLIEKDGKATEEIEEMKKKNLEVEMELEKSKTKF